MQAPKRGDFVVLRAFQDEPLVRRLWDIGDSGVFVLSDAEYRKRTGGHSSLDEVGFPIGDCYLYNADTKSVLGDYQNTGRIDWGTMTPAFPVVHA